MIVMGKLCNWFGLIGQRAERQFSFVLHLSSILYIAENLSSEYCSPQFHVIN